MPDGRMRVWATIAPSIKATEAAIARPPAFRQWTRLGLIVFLEMIDSSGSMIFGAMSGLLLPFTMSMGSSLPEFQSRFEGIADRLAGILTDPVLFFMATTVPLTIACLLWLAAIWVRSRAAFVFVHVLVHPDATLRDAWRQSQTKGRALFRFFIAYYTLVPLIVMGLAGAAIGLCVRIHMNDPHASWFAYVGTALPFVLLVVLVSILGSVTTLFLRSFVVPLMYRFDISCWQAWWRFWDIYSENLLPALGFIGVEIVYSMAISVMASVLGSMTCGLAYLPLVSQLILAPAYVAERIYTLNVLASAEPRCDMLPKATLPSSPPPGQWTPPLPLQ